MPIPNIPKALAPIAVTLLGLGGLMASWSCLPSLPLAQTTIVLKPTARPVTPKPETSPSLTPSPEPSPKATATDLPATGAAR